MSRTLLAMAAGCAFVLAAAAPSRADLLHVLSSPGILRSIDPSTGLVTRSVRLQASAGKVVPSASGLGTAPNGVTYGLVGIADACWRDPTRTEFAGGADDCSYIGGKEACDSAYVVAWDGPMSCTWTDISGCEACGLCLNTCAPPPTCEGSSRTHWVGFGSESCRQLDGDATACAGAYYSDVAGVWSCFESGGACLACDVAAQVAGACTAECAAPATCADGARDVFAGPFGCEQLSGDPDACARAFESNYGPVASACVASGDYCFPCTAGAEADGWCANSCVASVPCTGEPGRVRVPLCHAITDAEACAQSYTIESGEPASCFVNENHVCLPCTEQMERAGACADVCSPAVCEDPARTVLLPSPDACHDHDADPAACGAAFFVGRCGVSSCHYDAGAGACRPCTLDDPGRCENACGAFATTAPVYRPQLVTVDLASAAVTVLGSPGDWFEQPVGDGTGAVYVLGRFGACAEPHGVFRLDPGDLRPQLFQPLAGPAVGALARHPESGLLYRFASDGLFVTDPVTGITTPIAVEAPFWLEPRAMTWSPACNAFLVADDYQGLWILDRAAPSLQQAGYPLPGAECDEGNCVVGLAVEGTSVCPPVEPPTFTTTTTSTSTSSSTSTTTLPSELLSGRRLLITSAANKPRKRRLAVLSHDAAVSVGAGEGSDDDPTLHGGTLRVVAANGSFAATYPLDGGWRIVRKGGRMKGYEYRGDGPIRRIVLRPGHLSIRGQGPDLVQPLLQDPGMVRVVLQLGRRRWCLAFGGTFGTRSPRKLTARDAPAPSGCGEP